MKKEPITIELKPYDFHVTDAVYSHLFYVDQYETEDGLFEIPADSYQLVISALELIRWEVRGEEDREAFYRVESVLSHLERGQRQREWKRKEESARGNTE